MWEWNEIKMIRVRVFWGFSIFLFSRLILAGMWRNEVISVDYLNGSKRPWGAFALFIKRIERTKRYIIHFFFRTKIIWIFSFAKRGVFWKNSCSYIRREEKENTLNHFKLFELRHSLNLRCDRRYFWCVCARKLVTTRKFLAVI